eukprot:3815882-Pleurochrysis_carterae.AAC.2
MDTQVHASLRSEIRLAGWRCLSDWLLPPLLANLQTRVGEREGRSSTLHAARSALQACLRGSPASISDAFVQSARLVCQLECHDRGVKPVDDLPRSVHAAQQRAHKLVEETPRPVRVVEAQRELLVLLPLLVGGADAHIRSSLAGGPFDVGCKAA